MSKKFTPELEKLTTPDIRSALRWLNNNIEKTTKPTELASMKHDKCLKIIEDKYKPADIEKALDAIASGNGKTERAPKAPKAEPVINGRKFADAVHDLHDTADKLDTLIAEMKSLHGKTDLSEGASYVLELEDKSFVVIGASANGACILDGPHPSLDAAHKAWPEAILPGPISKEDDLKDML